MTNLRESKCRGLVKGFASLPRERTYGWKISSLCFVTTIFFAANLEVIGRLYFADVLLVAFVGFYIVTSFVSGNWRHDTSLVLLVTLPVIAAILDTVNRVPNDDCFRGAARNFVALSGVITGRGLVVHLGIKKALIMSVLISMAPTWADLLTGGERVEIFALVKYAGAGRVLHLMVLLLPSMWLQVSVEVVGALLTIFLFDSRGSGASSVAAVLIFSASPFLCRMRLWFFLICCTLGALSLIPVAVTFLTNSEPGQIQVRREMSNSQRYYMALSAWDGFLDRPLVGNGSWQHARNYIDESIHSSDDVIGVHSFILQLGYEYGIVGLVVGVGIALVGASGCWYFSCLYQKGVIGSGEALVGVLLSLGLFYGALFNPFAGYTRVTLGVGCGVVLEIRKRLKVTRSI